MKAVLRGIRRTIGSAKQGKAPDTADLIGQMLALCSANMIGRRDRALLAFGFAGAFRRSELCALMASGQGLRVWQPQPLSPASERQSHNLCSTTARALSVWVSG